MNPLYCNDTRGEFPPSWYAATTPLPALRPSLKGDQKADVVVVGAGYTGLHAAWELRKRGLSVIVLDAHRAGWGASGRNGGQVGSDYNKSQIWLGARIGQPLAQDLWKLAHEATDMVKDFCSTYAPEANFRHGIAHGSFDAKHVEMERRVYDLMDKHYPGHETTVLNEKAFRRLVNSKLYAGGTINRRAGHVHPLRYVLALAREAEAAGAKIFEMTEAKRIQHGAKPVVHCENGTVAADHVILAGNGYMRGLDRGNDARVMTVNSFIGVTEPLGDLAETVLGEDIAACDSSNVVNYFRLTEDRRLLFGGRANYTRQFPDDIGSKLHKRMGEMFPQIRHVPFTHTWGGSLGISIKRLPVVRRVAPNVLSISGYSGHGVALAGLAGKLMAEAVAGQAERFDTFSTLPQGTYPAGHMAQGPLLTLAMAWFRLRDKLGI